MTALRVLVVDDNRAAADALARVLTKGGDHVEAVYDGATAIERMASSPPDLVLTDLRMEPVDGMAVLEAARNQRPPVDVIVFTAYGDVDVAVRAMRLGARDFLTKPVTVDQVTRRLEQVRAEHQQQVVQDAPDFIARSSESKQLLHALRQIADVPTPTLLVGEVGAGRGHAALTLHRMGTPDQSYTIRDIARQEPWPERGTVLLPSIDDLPDDLQLALLRSLRSVPSGVRVLSTAGPEIHRLMGEGRFRSQLFFELAVVVIDVPPLRRRPEDIGPLLDVHLSTLAARYRRQKPTVSPEVVARLETHLWPGNVRELFNLAERAVLFGPEVLNFAVTEQPPDGLPRLEAGFNLSNYLEGIERRVLVEALRVADGDRNRAGDLLGVARNTLRYKLNKYGLLD